MAELSDKATPLGGVPDDGREMVSFLEGEEEGAVVMGAAVPVVLRAGVAVEDMSVAEGTNGLALTLRAELTAACVGARGDG